MMEQTLKKSLKTALIFLSIGLLLGTLIVFAATPSSPLYISSGIYPGAPSYTVWGEGGNYFAKDAHGQIDYSGTNAATVINNAVVAAGMWGGSVVCNGAIELTDPIIIQMGGAGAFSFEFERLQWISAFNEDAILINGTTSYTVWNGYFKGNNIVIYKPSYTHTALTLYNINLGHVDIGDINCYGDGVTGGGVNSVGFKIECNGTTGTDASFNTINIRRIKSFETAIMLMASNGGEVADNNLYDTIIQRSVNGTSQHIDFASASVANNRYYGLTIDGTGGALQIGFYNIGEYNAYIGVRTHDVPGGATAYYTQSYLYTEGRPRLIASYGITAANTVGSWHFIDNFEFIDQNSGTTAAITSGTSVTHGINAGTPTSITITATVTGMSNIYVDTVGSTSFKINFAGGGSQVFYWDAEYIP